MNSFGPIHPVTLQVPSLSVTSMLGVETGAKRQRLVQVLTCLLQLSSDSLSRANHQSDSTGKGQQSICRATSRGLKRFTQESGRSRRRDVLRQIAEVYLRTPQGFQDGSNLGAARRPVLVTSAVTSFWSHAYHDRRRAAHSGPGYCDPQF